MLLVALMGLVVLSVPLAGGRLSLLAHVRFRLVGLLVAGLALQVVIISITPSGSPSLHLSLIHI